MLLLSRLIAIRQIKDVPVVLIEGVGVDLHFYPIGEVIGRNGQKTQFSASSSAVSQEVGGAETL